MPHKIVITGTDTGIGKTVASAVLTLGLNGCYWKPVQSGLEEETDTQAVKRMTGLAGNHFFPETYRLNAPLSPHRAAFLDGIVIDPTKIEIPDTDRPLIIEGAGGLCVPLNPETLYIDLFQQWNLPVILCARTALGTINHSLLSIAAMKEKHLNIAGILFIGEAVEDSMDIIAHYANVPILGRIPVLKEKNAETLQIVWDDIKDKINSCITL